MDTGLIFWLKMTTLQYLQVLLEVSGGLARRQLHIDALQDTPELAWQQQSQSRSGPYLRK
jgi:hypothetical protein